MTSLLAGPVFPALDRRGSTHVGLSGLLVLGLGSLVLLTGLTSPNDVVMLENATLGSSSLLPQWLAGATMIAALAVIGLRRRVQSLLVLPVPRV
jgi:hypothetical protein